MVIVLLDYKNKTGDEYWSAHDFSPQGNSSAKMWFPFSEANVEGVHWVFERKLQSKLGTSHAYTVILKIVAWVSNMDVLIVSQVSILMELKYCRGKCYLIWSMRLDCILCSLGEVIGERILHSQLFHMASPAASAAVGWNSTWGGGIFKMIHALAGEHILDKIFLRCWCCYCCVLIN